MVVLNSPSMVTESNRSFDQISIAIGGRGAAVARRCRKGFSIAAMSPLNTAVHEIFTVYDHRLQKHQK